MAGVSLSAEGVSQAGEVADRLRASGLAAVYSSPLERARETAAPIAARAGLEVRIEPLLDEVEFGDWTGVAFDDLHQDARWADWNRERSRHRPPGGETIQEAQARVAAWAADAAARHPGQTIAAVSHADIVKALVLHILHAPIDRIHGFDVDPASITRIEALDGKLRLSGLNERAC